MAGSPLRIGVAGVGFGSLVHIPGLQSEGLEVVAVCARRRSRAEEAAARFGIPHVFDDFDSMLAMEGLDAVSIVTPPAEHLRQVTAALAAGKHVICEKPFARDVGEARQMLAAAEASGLTAMVAHEFRFASGRMRAKELIDEGYVGRPLLVRASMVLDAFGSARPPGAAIPPYNAQRDSAAEGAGMLFALGSHYIDGLIHWLGPVASVSAELRNLSPKRLDGDAEVLSDADNLYLLHLTFENGTLAEIIGSMALPFGTGAGIEVYGDAGALVTPQGRGWNPPAHGTVLGAQLGAPGFSELAMPERLQPFTDDRDDRLMPFRLLVREFVAGVAAGTSPSPNFADAVHCQAVLDAARLSSAEGRRVSISA